MAWRGIAMAGRGCQSVHEHVRLWGDGETANVHRTMGRTAINRTLMMAARPYTPQWMAPV